MKKIIALLLMLMLLVPAAMADMTDEELHAWALANGYVKVETDAISSATTVKAGGKFYTIECVITKHSNYLHVKDTLKNLTGKPIGIINRSHRTTPNRNGKPLMLSGLPVKTSARIHSPENASVFLPGGEGGCALIPNDDILQFQANTYVFKGIPIY